MSRMVGIIGLMLAVVASGCGQPQLANAEEQDYRLVMQLNAALASKRADLLATTADRLQSRHNDGKIPDEAFHALREMIERAKQGEWEQAHADCLELMKGQTGNADFARE